MALLSLLAAAGLAYAQVPSTSVALPSTTAPSVALPSSADYPGIPSDKTTPVQQRIAVAGPNAMSIGWNTYMQLNKACVTYGTSATSLNMKKCATGSYTYNTSRTWANAVTLPNLTPSTTYYYKIQSTNSTVDHFLSPRAAGDKTPFNMDVVVDMGVYGADGYTKKSKRDTPPVIQPELNHTTIGFLANTVNDYELVIHPGDFGYADDWFLKTQNAADGSDAYQAILENFYDQLAPVAARKAYMASPGNHEADCQELDYTSGLCPQGQTNFTDFMTRFGHTMPTAFKSMSSSKSARASAAYAKKLANPPFWYSFEYGMAHVVMFNTETDFPDAPDGQGGSAGLDGGPFGAPGQQLAFLQADLASVDRAVTPWLIVAAHRPWYSTGSTATSSNICGPCQTAFESLFYQYGVDLAAFGHVHNSQRFLPVYNGTADPNGLNNPAAPVYIVAGGAGNIEGNDAPGSNYSTNVFAYGDDFSLGQLQFLDANHLGVEFFRSSTGEVLDSSVLYKTHTQRFVRQQPPS